MKQMMGRVGVLVVCACSALFLSVAHGADTGDTVAKAAASAASAAASAADAASAAASSAQDAAKSAKDALANVPRSSPSNYLGDCFKLKANMPNLPSLDLPRTTLDVQRGNRLIVTSVDANDPDVLHVMVNKEPHGFLGGLITECFTSYAEPNVYVVRASDLVERGASRMGWVYGVLSLPFKYHFDDRSLDSQVSVGPYFGRRSEGMGLGWTWAVTAGISNVKAKTTDQNGQQQDVTTQAFTMAAGFIFDVSKSVKPFKIGLFIGQDRVGTSEAVTYKHDKKNWLAFQVGYDFTD